MPDVQVWPPEAALKSSIRTSAAVAISVAATLMLPMFWAPSASAVVTPVVSVTPLVDNPGSVAMTIVTVTNVPPGWAATLTARVGSLPTTCDLKWRHGGSAVSERCYVTLPKTVGSFTLRGTATLTRAGSTSRVYSGTLAVSTQGYASTPVTASVRAQITKCYNTTKNVRLTFDDGYTSASNLSSCWSPKCRLWSMSRR